jgi:hypothetical protein
MRKALPLALAALAAVSLARPARALDVDELVERNAQARGGHERLAGLRTLRLTGRFLTGESSDVSFAWTRVVKRPGLYREDVTLQGLTYVDGWDGQDGWRLDPFRGRREGERVSVDEARQLARDGDLDGVLLGAKARGATVTYLGTEEVDGTLAH